MDYFAHKELIYTIYREQSFSKAAQKLFISQPSLSQTVRKLETKLGVPLFDRSCKPIQLTEAGKVYIAAVEQLMHTEESFGNYLHALQGLEAGSLGIGSNQLLSSLVLPAYISAFTKAHPKIHLTLQDANSTTLQSELIAGDLDLVIDSHVYPPELFEKKRLASEQLLLALPAAYARELPQGLQHEDILAGRHRTTAVAPLTPEQLRGIPFILMNRNNDTRIRAAAIFQEMDFTPRVLLELDRLVTLYAYIENGTAASVVSDTLVRHIRGVDHSGIVFYPLPGRHAKRSIYVCWKRHKFFSKAMEAFLESLGSFL